MARLARRPILLLLVATPAFTATAAAPEAEPHFTVTLTPAPVDAAGHIPFVDLDLAIEGIESASGEPILRLPVTANTVETAAGRITGLHFRDAQGPVPAISRDKAEDDANRTRLWSPKRAVSGTLHVTYRVPIDPDRPPLAAPQYELRTEAGTFSGSATAFILLPADAVARRVRVRWDLDDLGAEAVGVSSFGVGSVDTEEAYAPERLASAYYMGGSPGLHRTAGDRFFGAWQGDFPFSGTELMEWAAKLQRFYGTFFEYSPERFGVFGRRNSLNPGSGIGLTHSFAFTFNETSEQADLRGLLAHEMLHAWVRSLDESMDMPGGLGAAWFGEGLAVHYQRLLPYRAGLISADDFLADLNQTAGRYYTNALIDTPNDAIPGGFWRDTRIRVLPYDRGSLYFARLDADIRRASGGTRSLDDLVRTMLATRRAGEPMGLPLWERLLREELGEKGIADFEAMLAGETVLPPSDAFGPCFRRTTRPLRRFTLGFDPEVLLARPRIVQGLVSGSSAEKAGLRDGDEILNSFPQDGLQADQEGMLTLEVRRGDERQTISYLPRGETVSAYQWERVPDASCTSAASEE